jgi:hypothetical protein
MNKFKVFSKYPILSIATIGTFIFIATPLIFSLVLSVLIVVPIYLAVQLFGGKE